MGQKLEYSIEDYNRVWNNLLRKIGDSELEHTYNRSNKEVKLTQYEE